MRKRGELKIRVAELDDCQKIARLHIESWRATYSGLLSDRYLRSLDLKERTAMWKKIVEANYSRTHIAVRKDEVVGFISIGPAGDIPEVNRGKNSGCIFAFYVDPQLWRRGYGSKLLWHAAKNMNGPYERLFLWVVSDNHIGKKFYASRGFLSHGVFKEEETEPGNPLKEELFSKATEEICHPPP